MSDLGGLATELESRLPGAVARDVPFADLSTYRIGGPVAVLARVRSEAALHALAEVTSRLRPQLLVAGRGSNLLVDDAGFPGLVVLLEGEMEELDLPVGDGPRKEEVVRAGGGLALPVLARRAAAAGWAGLEFYVGIPGSVGGAVRMNAGGHGRETADVLGRASLVDLFGPGTRDVTASELELGYRHSNVSPSEVVVAAEFAAGADDPAACEARVADVVRWRREHQPGGANAGSVFRNPPGDSAGRLIDATGLKGLRVGGAVVSDKHANFFQAEPGSTAADVRALIAEVRRRVAAATGVELVPELRIVGGDEDES